MFFKKPTLPLIIVFAIGLMAFVQEFIPHPWSGKFREEVTSGFRIIGGFGIFIGAYSLLHMHISRIRRKVPGFGYSIFVFIGAGAMIVAGMYNGGLGPLGSKPEHNDWFIWGYNNIQVPCQATIFSILAFYMASAAFRTFRAKNAGAALLLIAAIIVMFGRIPASENVSDWLFGNTAVFSKATDVIMEYPNLAAKRGILLGISLGMISQSLRILLGIERSYLGGTD